MIERIKNLFRKTKEEEVVAPEPVVKVYPSRNIFSACCNCYTERQEDIEFVYQRKDLFLAKSVFTKDQRRIFVKMISGDKESEVLEATPTLNSLIYRVDVEENGLINSFTINFEKDLLKYDEFWDVVGVLRDREFASKEQIDYYVEQKNMASREGAFTEARRKKKTAEILKEEFQGLELEEDEWC